LLPNKILPSYFSIQGNIGVLASQVTLAAPINSKTGFYISGRKTYIDEVVGPLIKNGSESNDVNGMNYGFSDGNFTFLSQLSKKNPVSANIDPASDKAHKKSLKLRHPLRILAYLT
jgi:hypothetical protein